MRISRIFRLALAVTLAAVPARAAAPLRLVLSGAAASPSPVAFALPMASAAAGSSPAPLAAPAALAPSLLPAPAPVPVPAKAAPEPGDAERRYADFFDGSAPPVEGEAVSPRSAAGESPTLRRPLQLNIVQSAVARALPALRESVALGGWNGPHTTLDESCCGDAAPKLAVLLRAQGIPARLVEAEFHYYVLLDLPDGQIVVDPTVRQFFGKKQAPKTIPHVFVGTVDGLTAFFQRHAASKTTKYDPRRIYFRDSVVREDALRAFEAAVRAGGAPEHGPLRRFLGLP